MATGRKAIYFLSLIVACVLLSISQAYASEGGEQAEHMNYMI